MAKHNAYFDTILSAILEKDSLSVSIAFKDDPRSTNRASILRSGLRHALNRYNKVLTEVGDTNTLEYSIQVIEKPDTADTYTVSLVPKKSAPSFQILGD